CGGHRRSVDSARAALDLPGVTSPKPPAGVTVALDGVTPWQTSASRFYRIDTALVPPAITPHDWPVRIHGMVDREITLSYDDLVARPRHELWLTLNCVSNEVGGNLISNAWWSGRIPKDPLAQAGVRCTTDT